MKDALCVESNENSFKTGGCFQYENDHNTEETIVKYDIDINLFWLLGPINPKQNSNPFFH